MPKTFKELTEEIKNLKGRLAVYRHIIAQLESYVPELDTNTKNYIASTDGFIVPEETIKDVIKSLNTSVSASERRIEEIERVEIKDDQKQAEKSSSKEGNREEAEEGRTKAGAASSDSSDTEPGKPKPGKIQIRNR